MPVGGKGISEGHVSHRPAEGNVVSVDCREIRPTEGTQALKHVRYRTWGLLVGFNSSDVSANHLSFVLVKIPLGSERRKEKEVNYIMRSRGHSVCLTQFEEQWADVIWEVLPHSDRAECEWALGLIRSRDGGPRILQMFQIQENGDLPLENRTKKKTPVIHAQPQEKRKMGPVCTAQRLAFSPARETKWKSMWC